MMNLLDLQENKITTDLSGYSLVLLGDSGIGKTYSIKDMLEQTVTDGRKPLFLMFEDRYQHIPGIMAVRIHNIPELKSIVSQLKNPKMKEKFSYVVIDTADAMDVMIEKFVADSKEVEIVGDLNFGKGNKYVKAQLNFVEDLMAYGWTVCYAVQSFENNDIVTKKTTVEPKLNKETAAKIRQKAYLVGVLEKDPSNPKDRIITFQTSEKYPWLKDSVGMPSIVKVSNFAETLRNAILNIEGAEFTDKNTINSVVEEVDFEKVKTRGMELGSLLASSGYLEEAMNVLKVNLGYKDEKNTQPRLLDDLLPAQVELAQIVVMEFESLVKKYKLESHK